jgi:O-antigen ligase
LPAVLGALFIPLAAIGVALTLSRAGFILVAAALLGALAVVLRSGALRSHWRLAAALALPTICGGGAVLLFAMGPIIARFGRAEGPDLRFEGFPVVLRAARQVLPIGSGVGSFDPVYRAAEPLGQIGPTYFNHAHNDYLELWLETGVAGAMLLVAFAVWFGLRAVQIWTGKQRFSPLAAAASIVIALLLAHSAADYPLRTEALAVLFSYACAEICAPGRSTARANVKD